MAFNPLSEPVDHVILAGVRSPGIAEIVGFKSTRSWDELRGHGTSGARLRFKGTRLARGKLILHLYTDEHWADWDTFRALIQRAPVGAHAHALEIVHPITEGLGVRSVVVETISQPTQTSSGGGEWSIEIDLIEYREPVIALSTPDGAQAEPEPENGPQRAIRALAGIVENGGEGDAMAALVQAFAQE